MTPRAEDTSRAIGDIDLTAATPQFSIDFDQLLPPIDRSAERLARVERLLEADLAALGPTMVTASIAEITDRLDALAARIDDLSARWERAEEQLAGSLATRVEQRLDRLTRLVEAATEPEPECVTSPIDPALAVIGSRLDELSSRLDALGRILG